MPLVRGDALPERCIVQGAAHAETRRLCSVWEWA